MLPYGRKNPLPFPLFRSGHMSAICARLSKGKGRKSEGGNRRCLPSCAPARRQRTPLPRGAARSRRPQAAQLPAEVQRKTSRPLGANTPAAVRVPRSAGAKKKPPVRGEHAYAVRIPRSAGAEKTACAVRIPSVALYRENEKGTAHAVPLPSTDMSVAQQQQLPQLPQPPQVLSPQVPQEQQPPLP